MNGNPQAGVAAGPPSSPSRPARTGSALAGLVAHLALVDAAVETVLSGSPLRAGVAAVVVVFLALSAWAWRPGGMPVWRAGWVRAAAAPIWVLGALLVASAWLPGGQDHGVRMLGQPTSTLLTVATAAGVILGAFVLVRGAALIPAATRPIVQAIVVALALYAVVALGLGVAGRVPFAALFRGESTWQALPWWLQGPSIGAALAVLALVAQAGRLRDFLRRGRPVRVLARQALALVTVLAMAASGMTLPVANRASSTTHARPLDSFPSAEPAAGGATYEQRQQSWVFQSDPGAVQRFARAAGEELERPGADPSDVRAAAEALGHDAQRIFEFLRDRIRVEPYAGILRGARGTLAAGAGNALDRALLGQALLKASGVESRIVAGRMPADRATRVLSRFLAADSTEGPLGSCALDTSESARTAAARELSAKAGLPSDRVTGLLNQASARAHAFWSRADEQRAAHHEFLAGRLRQAGVKPSADAAGSLAMLTGRLEQHYWLQVADDGEQWSDFDPSLPDAQRGTAYGSTPAPLDEVPEDLWHRFELDLVYVTSSHSVVEEEVLVTGSFPSADALFEPLEFRIQPATAPVGTGALLAMDAGQKIGVLRKIKRFQGILRAGDEVRAGRLFDLAGHTFSAQDAGGGGGPAGLGFGAIAGGGQEDEASGQFVELRVVFRLSGPGREPSKQTRTLVRAADLANPAFAPPLMEWEILVQPQWISGDLAGHQLLRYLMAARAGLESELAPGGAGRAAPVPPYPQQLIQLALLRQAATASILAEQAGVRALVDGPLLTIAGHRLTALRDGEARIDAERTIDIVENAIRFVGQDPASQPAAFDAALRQGAADATLEHRFLQESFPQLTIESGVELLQQSQRERRPTVLAGPREADALRRAGLGDADIEWIRANEPAASRLLVATSAASPATWWSVRPDGTSVLRVSGGRGQAAVEHQTDVMLVSLKVMFGLICGFEVVHSGHGEPTAAKGWKIAFCTVATGLSLGFVMAHAHVASWILIGIETVEFASSGLQH